MNKKNLTWPILYSLMGVTLLGSLIYFNFFSGEKKPAEVSENKVNGKSTNEFTFTSFHHEEIVYSPALQDEKDRSSFLVFLDDADDKLIESFSQTKKQNETCDFFVIFPYQKMTSLMQKVNVDYQDYDIQFGYDDISNAAIQSFLSLEEVEYPYCAYIDQDSNIISTSKDVSRTLNLVKKKSTLLTNPKQGVENHYLPEDSFYQYLSHDTFNIRESLGKVTFINFWGTWCGPCVKEMPHFNQLRMKYDVNVIAIHSSESETDQTKDTSASFKEEVESFIHEHVDDYDPSKVWKDYQFTFLQDKNGSSSFYSRLGGTSVYPMTFVLDDSNIIRRVHSGSVSYDDLEQDYLSYK